MDRLTFEEKIFNQYEYLSEAEFEKDVINNASNIFGLRSVYVDVKKRIGKGIVSIPDGYLIDFSFPTKPRLYIIEVEISTHDPYKHIGEQLLRFSISYKNSGQFPIRDGRFITEEERNYNTILVLRMKDFGMGSHYH